MAPVSVRYIVHDVDAAVAFYTQRLGFSVELRPAPGFAVVSRGDLRLLLSAPTGLGGAAQPMPDGRKPEPGGWNRIQLQVDAETESGRQAGSATPRASPGPPNRCKDSFPYLHPEISVM